uniref:Uncharacterized protein n=1 Tax=Parastrongyloides trichosuri TaxID=131310 RepID=A0A0N4ZZ74_PARTI
MSNNIEDWFIPETSENPVFKNILDKSNKKPKDFGIKKKPLPESIQKSLPDIPNFNFDAPIVVRLKKRENDNEKNSNVKAAPKILKRKLDPADKEIKNIKDEVKKVRFEIDRYRIGMTKDPEERLKANIDLAIRLGAKKPKGKAVNLKEYKNNKK